MGKNPINDGNASEASRLAIVGTAPWAASGPEAFEIGLANRLASPRKALETAIKLAEKKTRFPQGPVHSDHRLCLSSAC
jgi:enoyl-CoA hydratase/carnithine racemase